MAPLFLTAPVTAVITLYTQLSQERIKLRNDSLPYRKGRIIWFMDLKVMFSFFQLRNL